MGHFPETVTVRGTDLAQVGTYGESRVTGRGEGEH